MSVIFNNFRYESRARPDGQIVTTSLVLNLDAANPSSYSGSGTTWFDVSGSGNNLTLTGSPTFSDGYFTFNGSSQYARTTTLPTTTRTNFSMCAWINPSSINQLGMVISNGRDGGSGDAPYSGYALGIGDATGSSGSKLAGLASSIAWMNSGYTFASTNVWYNIVMTRDTTTSRFYVNGTQTAGTSTATPLTPTQNFVVGAAHGTSAVRFFAGRISNVLFYTKQLSVAEVTQNFNALRGRYGI